MDLSQEDVRARLDYEPKTGVFTWKFNPRFNKSWNSKYAGKIAGGIDKFGYIRIRMFGQENRAGRLAWIYMKGSIPEGMEIDHKDRNPLNNSIENLRPVTGLENCENRIVRMSTVNERYISFTSNRFAVRISFGRGTKYKYLGRYKTIEEAISIRDAFIGSEND